MNELEFYRATVQAAFTLLGLWSVVAQFKYRDWVGRPEGRRLVLQTSLLFFLPGLMSLFSLIADDTDAVWRTAFGVASAGGAISVVAALVAGTALTVPLRSMLGAAAVLYAAVVLVALAPDLSYDLVGLAPLEAEAGLISLMLATGVTVAWLLLSRDAGEPGERP
jgi:hypothetical protein